MSLKGLERIWLLRKRKTAGNLSGFQGLGTHSAGKFAQSFQAHLWVRDLAQALLVE